MNNVPNTVLDSEDNTQSLCSHRAYILVRREILFIEGNKYNEEKMNRLSQVKKTKNAKGWEIAYNFK